MLELKLVLILRICSEEALTAVFMRLAAVVICAIQHRPPQVVEIYGH